MTKEEAPSYGMTFWTQCSRGLCCVSLKACYFVVQSLTTTCPTLQPHGLEHTRLPCPSLSSGFCSNSCPSSQWCHPTTSSSGALFFSCLQSFPASESFPVSQLFPSGDPSIGVSATGSVPSMNIQGWFPLRLASLISLQSKGLSRVFSRTTVQKHQFFPAQPSLWSNTYMTTGTTIALAIQTFVNEVMSLPFNMLSRLVITFLPRSKHLLISWLQSLSAVILEPKKITSYQNHK